MIYWMSFGDDIISSQRRTHNSKGSRLERKITLEQRSVFKRGKKFLTPGYESGRLILELCEAHYFQLGKKRKEEGRRGREIFSFFI